MVTAKGFSEENLPENKALYLELIETIILKMNGDTNKYFKICGSSTLSRRSRDSIDARMAKAGTGTGSDGPHNASLKKQSPESSPPLTRTPSAHIMSRAVPTEDNEGPFKFSYAPNGTKIQSPGDSVESKNSLPDDIVNRREASSGAAASLRERLRQIRDKHAQEGDPTGDSPSNVQSSRSVAAPISCPLYNEIVDTVEILLGEPTPLLEVNEIFTKALICLRQLHSSLSNNSNDSTGTDPALLKKLRQHLHYKVPEVVKLLTRYVRTA